MPELAALAPREAPAGGIIKLAVLAVGGQGGGVLADWIVDAAERSGFIAQSTSVAGVAQRTGSTIYYVEMCRDTGRLPVMSLSPAQGDVDILVAAEMMEAGRAIMRGFVTPDRTTLIASSHRIAAVSEKIVPGDGRASSEAVREAALAASRRFIAFDMEKIALEAGSVISASLLGALAGSGALPFPRESWEAAVKAGGRGVNASLAAFAGAYARAGGDSDGGGRPISPLVGEMPALRQELWRAEGGAKERKPRPETAAAHLTPSSAEAVVVAEPARPRVSGPARQLAAWQVLAARVAAFPEPLRDMAGRGLKKVVDYQDLAYGGEYLDRLARATGMDDAAHGFALSIAAAKHLANGMCYDDMIRVADLKTRSTRARRVRREVGAEDATVVRVTEYFHPRVEEFCGTMPVRLGRYIENRPGLARFIDRRINRGRHIRTDSVVGFSMLWVIGGLRRWRRRLLRHHVEAEHLERWYQLALSHVPADYALAVEVLECRRLIKGYSDTHVRAQSKFDRVLSALPLLEGRTDAAEWLRRLRELALKDEKGDMLDGALKTVASLQEG